MLYVSTRNCVDSYTAYRALHEEQAPDGGFFVPHRLPVLSDAEIAELAGKTVGERIARILNIFFPVGLNGWDVDFAIGRHPFKLVTMSHRLFIVELWHNLNMDFHFLERSLYSKLCENDITGTNPSNWAKIAIRTAVLFGVCCELLSRGIKHVDIAGITGDYAFVMAAWYARKMGLPIEKIVCTSDEKGGAWDLFQKGEISTAVNRQNTTLSQLDISCPPLIEMLIYENFGVEEVASFLNICKKRGTYRLSEDLLERFAPGIEGAVVSRVRCPALVKSIFRTHDYVSDPYMAIAYGGLQDFRSRTGESRTTLILSEISPVKFDSITAESTGASSTELKNNS